MNKPFKVVKRKMRDDIEISRAVNLKISLLSSDNVIDSDSAKNIESKHELVNQIRHKNTDYDKEMARFTSPVAARIYKKRMLNSIGTWFPNLKFACEQQIRYLK